MQEPPHRRLADIRGDLPALRRAFEIGARAASVGFDWPRAADVLAKIEEEINELRAAARSEARARVVEEMGDVLFALANLARKLSIEPEAALHRANEKFTRRFHKLEQRLRKAGTSLDEADLDTMESEWQRIKHRC